MTDVPKEAFQKAGIKLVVVGCGEASVIEPYKGAGTISIFTAHWELMLTTEITKFSGEIYADPSRKLYHILGMTIETLETTPKGQQRKSYLPNYATNVAQSIWVSDTSALKYRKLTLLSCTACNQSSYQYRKTREYKAIRGRIHFWSR